MQRRVVSVSSRIAYLLQQLYQSAQVSLRAVFSQSADRPELVATFMAVLELIKARRALLDEEGCQLRMRRGEAPPQPENTVPWWEEEDAAAAKT